MSINTLNLKTGDLVTEDHFSIIDENFTELENDKTEILNALGGADLTTNDKTVKGGLNEVRSQLNEKANKLSAITVYLDSNLEDYTQNLSIILNNSLIPIDKKIRLILPGGSDVNFATVILTRPNVEFLGGCLNGNLILNIDTPSDCRFINVNFDDVKFKKDVEIWKGRGIQFNNCVFQNTNKSIYCNPQNDAIMHGIGLVGIYGCRFYDVNYNLYINKNINAPNLQCNDFTYSNNYSSVTRITAIYAEEMDGILIDNNTFFTMDNDPSKEYLVCIKAGDWINVTNNQLFGSGYETVYLYNCYHQKVQNNTFAWNGQRKPSSAIKIECSSDRFATCHSIISGNIISGITSHGIEIINAEYQTIIGNYIECYMSNNSNYYGNVDLSTIAHYGIYTNVTSYRFNVDNNFLIKGTSIYNQTIGRYNIKSLKDSNAPNIDNSTGDVILIACNTLCTFKNIQYGINGDELTLVALNENSIIENNSQIRLKNSVSVNIPKNGILKLLKINNIWFESSRSFEITTS